MTSVKDEIKTMKNRLESRKSDKKYDKAADAAINIAELYREQNECDEAFNYYEEAKFCISKVAEKTAAVLQNEFLAYRGCLEMTYHESEEEIKQALKAFLEYVQRLKDPTYKQIALHIASYTYQKHLTGEDDYLENAKSYSLSSIKMLEEYGEQMDEILKKRYNNTTEFEEDDSKRRLSGSYQLLASICDEEGDSQAAENYINKALKFDRLEKDPVFHHTILSTKRKYVARERQHEISSKMLKLLDKMDAKDRAKNLPETLQILAADSLTQKNLVEAGKIYWQIYNNKKGVDRDIKKDAKEQLIKLHKIKERKKELKTFEEMQPRDYRVLAKMYEKIADEMLALCAYELAIDFYLKMKDASVLISPGDPEYGDLQISRGAMISLAETYNDLFNYEDALRYYEKLNTIEIRLNSCAAALAENRLNVAMSKSYCKHFTFEEQRDAFEKVKMPAENTILYKKYLQFYVEFLKKHKNKKGVSLLLNDLTLELEKYEQILADSQDIAEDEPVKSSQDKYDFMPHDEIIQEVKKCYEYLATVVETRKKINHKNPAGENLLHEAAKISLKKVKFLIEKCGFRSVIDAKDNGHWTPLSEAVSHEHADIVEYLIENGADMNTLSKAELLGNDGEKCTGAGQSPLMEACSIGHFQIICTLVGNGANACLTNENGWTAGDYLEEFIQKTQMDNTELQKYKYVLDWLRNMEEKGKIKNRQKKLDLPTEPSKKPIPRPAKRKRRQQGGVEMFKEALSNLGRKPILQNVAKSRKFESDGDDDKMLEDDDFIAPDSDEDEDGELNGMDEDSDEAMDIDDDNFRQINGFSKHQRSSAAKGKSQKPNRRRSNRNKVIESDEDDDVMVICEKENTKSPIERRKRKGETLKRRSCNRSFESSSSSSKKTKRSTSISKKTDISKSSDNNSVVRLVDSLSLSQPPPRLNIDARELDFSFSENVAKITTELKLHLNLQKLCLKGSDFDDGINEVIDAVCTCHKLVELDLSQVENIESSHVNKILKKCLKLKVLDVYGTAVTVIDLQSTYVLEKLIIAKTPFEYSDGFYEQINALSTLSFLDVSHTNIDLNELFSKLSVNRTKLHIKASSISSYCDYHRLSRILPNFGTDYNITVKLTRSFKEELLSINSTLNQFLKD